MADTIELLHALRAKTVANLHAQPRELLRRSELLASIGPEMLFARVEDAVAVLRARAEAAGKRATAAEASEQSAAVHSADARRSLTITRPDKLNLYKFERPRESAATVRNSCAVLL